MGWGRFDDAIKDLGGVAFGKIDLGGTTREKVDLKQPVGHGVAAFVLGVESLFSCGGVRESEDAIGSGANSGGGGIGGGLAHSFKV